MDIYTAPYALNGGSFAFATASGPGAMAYASAGSACCQHGAPAGTDGFYGNPAALMQQQQFIMGLLMGLSIAMSMQMSTFGGYPRLGFPNMGGFPSFGFPPLGGCPFPSYGGMPGSFPYGGCFPQPSGPPYGHPQVGSYGQHGAPRANPNQPIPDYGPSPSRREIGQILDAMAAKYGIPPNILKAVAWQESGWNPRALSFDGQHGKGVMQIDDRFHQFACTNEVFDPVKNIEYGAQFLRKLYDQTGSWEMALKRYNGGSSYPPKIMAHANNQPWQRYIA